MKRVISVVLSMIMALLSLQISASTDSGNASVMFKKNLPTDDTFVANSPSTKGTVYGNENYLYSISRPYDNEARKIYMKFDCSDLSGDYIASAKLYIKSNPRTVNGIKQSDTNVNISAISNYSWSEKNVCWMNRPEDDFPTDLGQFYYKQDNDTWYSIDVTDYLKNDKTLSLLITSDDISSGRCYFYSKESGEENAPHLDVTTGFNVVKDFNYVFKDSQGNIIEAPTANCSITSTITVNTALASLNKATMLICIYDKKTEKLLQVSCKSNVIPNGTDADVFCTLDNLSTYSRSTIIKAIFMTNLEAENPFGEVNTYVDNTLPVYPDGQITIVSPEYRSDITADTITVQLFAPKFDALKVECAHQPDETSKVEYNKVVKDKVVPESDGYAEFDFPAKEFEYGPIAITISGKNNGTLKEKYLQLYNTVGVKWNIGQPDTPPNAQGMKLAYVDDFDGPLSISRTDTSKKYFSHTPYMGDYGDARFEDFEGKNNPFEQRDSFMKIKARAPEGYAESNPTGKKYYGGLISSVYPNGTGLSWKNAYFECRMLMPPGIGVWPSFWVLSKNRLDPTRKSTGELDIVEGYLYQDDLAKICVGRWSFSDDIKQFGDYIKYDMTKANMLNLCQAFHTYACKITDDTIYFYIDNQLAWAYPTYDEVRGDMMFLINLALGKGGGPETDLSEYNMGADLYVDYVRVYIPNK